MEVEVTQHSFYNHIFPQVTKFFAFYKNTNLRKELIDKLYTIVDRDSVLRSAFKSCIGRTEIYKFLSDIVDASQNILLIADGPIPELAEITDTYTDTWGRLVKFVEIRKCLYNSDFISTITPDFETIQYIEHIDISGEDDEDEISEAYHLEYLTQPLKEIYGKIKELALSLDNALVFNPQKYYISIKAPKNIAFIKFRKKKVQLIAMMPEERIRAMINYYPVVSLSKGVQKFYNGPCAAVDIADLSQQEELRKLLSSLVNYHRGLGKAGDGQVDMP